MTEVYYHKTIIKPKTELLSDYELDRYSNNGWNLHLLTLSAYNAIYIFRKKKDV